MSSSVLITGSNRGIGRELLKKYLALSNTTIISGVRDDQHPTVDEIRKFPV
jgi:norsolorinic acid ketoreductase